jgi:septal ring factor EnvC (AmiA/AmiB activator)
MDSGLITAIVAALGVGGTLAAGWKRRVEGEAKRGEAQAAAQLENERQESAVQAHLIARMAIMDTRIAQLESQLEAERAEFRRARWELEDTNRSQSAQIRDLQTTVAELGADKARLAGRVVELEREVAAANGRADALGREFAASLELARPSTLSERPPGGQQ